MHALNMYTHMRHGYDREDYERNVEAYIYLEVHNIGFARQFLADEGVQPKEGKPLKSS